MPSWPATLPTEPNNGKHKETPPDTLIRDKNEVGPNQVRSRALAGVTKLSLPYRFTAAQTDIFVAWLRDDLQRGALAFDFAWPPPPRDTQPVLVRLANSAPTLEHQGGGVYDVTLEVEILPGAPSLPWTPPTEPEGIIIDGGTP